MSLVFKPQTSQWLDKTCEALASRTLPSPHAWTSQRSRRCLSLTMGAAVAFVNAFVRQCVTPAVQTQISVSDAPGESHWSATVSVAQPLSVTSERYRKTQCGGSRRQLLACLRVARVQAAGHKSLKVADSDHYLGGFQLIYPCYCRHGLRTLLSTNSAFPHIC
jgi:hypothetical protein